MSAIKRVEVERSGRFYMTPDGTKLPSVTNILGCIGKPALINWAAKVERELCIEAAANLWEDVPTSPKKMSRTAYIATLNDRLGKTKAHQRELAKAGDIGSEAHALIEWNLRSELGQKVGPQPRISDKATWAFMAYEEWRKGAGLVPKAIEQTIWNPVHGYAGTLDVLGTVTLGGAPHVAVLDWKTGKAIYAEALLQNAAYVRALIEMEHLSEPVHGLIVRLPKTETDPDFEVKVIPPEEHHELFLTFLAVKALWDWQQDQEAKRSADPRDALVAQVEARRKVLGIDGIAWQTLCKAQTDFVRYGYAEPPVIQRFLDYLNALPTPDPQATLPMERSA